PSAPVAAAFGSGLKRPLEVDESGRPVLKKRKRTKAKSAHLHAPEELEWEGFDPESEDDELSENSLKSHDSGDENSSEDGTRTSSSDGDDFDTSGEESE
ncbi:putative ATP-dependent RNA helicase DHR1, partial [Cryomyces antarcticus]